MYSTGLSNGSAHVVYSTYKPNSDSSVISNSSISTGQNVLGQNVP